MWKQDFNSNWRLDLQQKIWKEDLSELETHNIYLESNGRFIAFLEEDPIKRIVKVTGSYEIQNNHCVLKSFERDTNSALSNVVNEEFVLPFFLLIQYLHFMENQSNLNCYKKGLLWIVGDDEIQTEFRTELAAKALQLGCPLYLAVQLESFGELEQKRFFEARNSCKSLPICFRKLGIPWILEMIPPDIQKKGGSEISKKFS